ncbi:MAG: hypothetical protein IKP71_09170, partial [Candidatus Riflebacteria bacterium]|nr:hypothetical protein [Candidatus Riflebacteria bacterium]
MRIPASLKKNPIIDVTMEFRFNSNLEYELIPGAFWAKIPDEIKNKFRFERLPIADMPIQIRKMTPNWKIIPYFQFVSQDLLI